MIKVTVPLRRIRSNTKPGQGRAGGLALLGRLNRSVVYNDDSDFSPSLVYRLVYAIASLFYLSIS